MEKYLAKARSGCKFITFTQRVRMVVHTTSKEVFAMKILDKDTIKKEDLISNLKKEISIMMLISHPNVVKLIEVLASKTKIYIVLEYIKGGELWHLISNFCG